MLRILPVLLMLVDGLRGFGQSPSVIPFEPLPLVDTIVSMEQLERYTNTCDVIGYGDTYTEAQETDFQPACTVFMKRVDATVTVYDLPMEEDVHQDHTFLGFVDGSRFAMLEMSYANLAQRHETAERELWIIDRWAASFARFAVSAYSFEWEFEENTERQIDHKSEHIAQYLFDGNTLTYTKTCTANGEPVPCIDPGGMYTMDGMQLVRTHTYDPVLKEMVPLPTAAPTAMPAVDTVSIAATMTAPDGFVGTCFDSTKFRVARPDTLFPGRYRNTGRTDGLVKLTAEDRTAYLQRYAAQYDDAELYFFAILLCDAGRREITILSTHHDDNDVLWLSYDRENQLNGIDTLLTSWGDGQYSTDEYAYWEPWGSLTIVSTTNETARDGNDTMAYLIDTLLYDWRTGNGALYIPEEGAEPLYQYIVDRVPQDLARHWLIKFPTEEPAKEQRYSLRSAMPPHTHAFLTTIGDLNGDKEDDYVFALEPDTGLGKSDGLRDLQIVFSTPGGFQEKLFLSGFFPGRSSGGFHDPIGEECCSGISISGDTLIIGLFGGSAWKWQSRDYYQYSKSRDAFFLIKEEARSYHGPSVANMYEDLEFLEQLKKSGKKLDAEQKENLTRLRKMVADYEWHPAVHPMGKYPIGTK